MAKTNTGVIFVLKHAKKETSSIKAIFCFAYGQMYYYERKLSIPTKFWNKNSQRAKETKAFPEYAYLNATLDAIETTILDCYRKYRNEFNKEPEIEELRNLIKESRGTGQSKNVETLEFLDFIQLFIDEAKAGKYINLARGTQITMVTIRTYQQTLRLLKAYSDYIHKQLKFDNIDTIFYKDFVYYLSDVYISPETKTHLKVNTIGKHLTNIKTFMNTAIEKKFTANDSFRNRGFKVIRENVDTIALTEEEITALEKLDLNNNPRLEKVRDIFLIGCDTALRVSDLKRLTKNHVFEHEGKQFIKIEMKKTGKPVVIPITERVNRLMKKYESSTSHYFPKAISDQKANEYIKEIAKQVQELNIGFNINSTINGLRVSKTIPKYELITNHTARRSFATNWALKGVPYNVIMRITGHATEKSFARYIKIGELEGAMLFEIETNKSRLHAV